MPAKTEKQRRFMAAVANDPKFAKKVGVPQSIGDEFMMKKYAKGGAPKTSMRPRMRPESEEDGPPRRSMRPRARPEDIGSMPSGSTRGMNPEENYSPEDMKQIRGMKKGGKVRGAGIAKKGVRACKMC